MAVTIIVSASRWLNESHRDVVAEQLDDFAEAVDDGTNEFRLVHGDARGGDRLIASIAEGWDWDAIPVPAEWEDCGEGCPPGPHRKVGSRGSYCPEAGKRRNRLMIDRYGPEAAGLLGFPERGVRGRSGTWDAIHYAADQGLHVVTQALKVTKPAKQQPTRERWLQSVAA